MIENTFTCSKDEDEWYHIVFTCNKCGCKFMMGDWRDDPAFCPKCGIKFIEEGVEDNA